MLENLKIKTKLLGGFILVALIAGIVGLVGYNGMQTELKAQGDFATIYLPSVSNLQYLMEQKAILKSSERTLLINGLSKERVESQFKQIEEAKTEIKEHWDAYAALPQTPNEEIAWKEFTPLWESYMNSYDQGIELLHQYYNTGNEETYLKATQVIMGKTAELFTSSEESLDKVLEINLENAKETDIKADETASNITIFLIILIIAAVVLSIVLGIFIAGNIQKIIDSVVGQVKTLVTAAVGGQLATRANPEETNFEFREITVGVNQTLDALILPLNVTAEYVDRIAKGDMPPVITDNYNGDFNKIKTNLNAMIIALNDVTEKAKLVSIGDLNVELTLRSDKDELMKSLQNMVIAFREITDKVKILAKGDLTVDLKIRSNEDELVQSLSEMVKSISGVVVQVQSAANSIASASEQMSSNAQQVSQGASEQASAAEEVSSSMEEMGSNIQQNTQNAQQTEKISVTAAQGMEKVKKSSNESLKSINEIADKITIIGDIAFQTNILALNAAVEAARAGEHGKGFAVVAAEVRKLAERSKVAAEEINSLSKSSVGVTNEASKLMEDIIPDVEKTSKLVQEITAASIEQNSGANQINHAINQLNQVTQQNAAAAEEMATSSEELSGHAQQLNDLISFFKVDENEVRKVSGYTNKPKAIEHKSFKSNNNDSKMPVKASQNKGVKINIEENDSEFERF